MRISLLADSPVCVKDVLALLARLDHALDAAHLPLDPLHAGEDVLLDGLFLGSRLVFHCCLLAHAPGSRCPAPVFTVLS